MTEPKITRERLMALLEAASYDAEHFIDTTQLRLAKERVAIFTLALQALDMQPRPNALVIQEHGAWVAMLVDKDIMAQGPTAEIAMERLHEVVSIETEDTDHFEALKPNPIARLFHISLPEPRT